MRMSGKIAAIRRIATIRRIGMIRRIAALCIAAGLCVAGCRKNAEERKAEETEAAEETASAEQNEQQARLGRAWANLEGKKVAVVLGHGFNDEESVRTLAARLDGEFGVSGPHSPRRAETSAAETSAAELPTADNSASADSAEDDSAHVLLLVFPDDFMKGGRPRVSRLPALLEDVPLAGILTLGAPDGTHSEIARLQDKEESGILPYPVAALFPQDDVLAAEAMANFVIDHDNGATVPGGKPGAEPQGDSGQVSLGSIAGFSVENAVVRTVQAMAEAGGPIPPDRKLAETVREILGGRTARAWLDSGTKIQSINHFTFE